MTDQNSKGFVFGEGRISSYISFSLGILSLLGVFCFLFPEYLTTPQLRRHYPIDFLRQILFVTLLLTFLFGLLSFILTKNNRLARWGILFSTIAILLGGATVEVKDFDDKAFQIGVDWLALDLLILALVFIPIERIFPRYQDQITLRDEWKTDLTYFAISHLLVQITAILIQQPAAILFGWIGLSAVQNVVVSLPFVIQFIAALLFTDLAQYAVHRAFHWNSYLWRFHAIHHSIKSLDWLSGSRIHIVDVLITRSFGFIPLYILGFSTEAFAAYIIFVAFQTTLIHSNTDINFGFLRYIFVTPQHHHWHHSNDPETYGKNFAVHLPVIDMIFGTFYLPKGEWPSEYGISKPIPKDYLGQFLSPFKKESD